MIDKNDLEPAPLLEITLAQEQLGYVIQGVYERQRYRILRREQDRIVAENPEHEMWRARNHKDWVL